MLCRRIQREHVDVNPRGKSRADWNKVNLSSNTQRIDAPLQLAPSLLSPRQAHHVAPGGPPRPRPAARVQPQGSSAAPPQSLARCAPAGATARREARVHTQGEACPLAGGAGGSRTRSRGAGAQMPFAFPRRSAGPGGAASVWQHTCPRRRLTPAAAAAVGRGRRWCIRCALFFL
jgi:hypothetical protein